MRMQGMEVTSLTASRHGDRILKIEIKDWVYNDSVQIGSDDEDMGDSFSDRLVDEDPLDSSSWSDADETVSDSRAPNSDGESVLSIGNVGRGAQPTPRRSRNIQRPTASHRQFIPRPASIPRDETPLDRTIPDSSDRGDSSDGGGWPFGYPPSPRNHLGLFGSGYALQTENISNRSLSSSTDTTLHMVQDLDDISALVNEASDCPICQENKSPMRQLYDCGHKYCSECLQSHVTSDGEWRLRCPMDRSLIQYIPGPEYDGWDDV